MPTPEKSTQPPSGPAQVLSLADATAIIVGLIIGAGIFGTPSIVAGAVESPALLVAVWVAGGVFSVIGAQCCAENTPPATHTAPRRDRKRTRLNSSHVRISYAVFIFKKKNDVLSDSQPGTFAGF